MVASADRSLPCAFVNGKAVWRTASLRDRGGLVVTSKGWCGGVGPVECFSETCIGGIGGIHHRVV